jgi:hypothetical protein
MAAGSTLNVRPTPRRAVAANTGSRALEDSRADAPEALPSTDPEAAAQPLVSGPDRPASASGSLAAERDERRRERDVAREDAATRGEPVRQGKTQPMTPSRRTRLVLGETVSVGLIGILVAGLVAGAILGALGAPGWVVGLLVATLTVSLSAVLRRFPNRR